MRQHCRQCRVNIRRYCELNSSLLLSNLLVRSRLSLHAVHVASSWPWWFNHVVLKLVNVVTKFLLCISSCLNHIHCYVFSHYRIDLICYHWTLPIAVCGGYTHGDWSPAKARWPSLQANTTRRRLMLEGRFQVARKTCAFYITDSELFHIWNNPFVMWSWGLNANFCSKPASFTWLVEGCWNEVSWWGGWPFTWFPGSSNQQINFLS